MLSVLFVDDEPNILRGYKRIFHARRKSWQIHLAGSGAEALKLLEETHVDVIITDMRMPGMDGARLLNIIRLRYPHIIRIILSGQSDEEEIMNSVLATHRFLSKPTDAQTLREAIEQSVSFREKTGNVQIRGVVSQIDHLPSLPELYMEIENILRREDFELKEVASVIEKDMAMTASILKLVNSAFFGIPRKVSTMQEAVSYLGVVLIKSLVLNHSLFSTGLQGLHPDFIRRLWRHSNETVRHALCLARGCFREQEVVDEITLAASVHDIGMLIIANSLPEEFATIQRQSLAGNVPAHSVEQDVLQTTHAAIGAYLAHLWSFPPAVVELILHHHDSAINFKPLFILHLADVGAQQSLNDNYGFPQESLDKNSMSLFNKSDPSLNATFKDCLNKGWNDD